MAMQRGRFRHEIQQSQEDHSASIGEWPNHLPEESIMKHIIIATLALAFGFALPALAQTGKEMSPAKMKCEDFVAVDEAYQPALVYWVAGVDKLGVRETDTMVVDTATPIALIVGECKKTPKASFKSKVRELYKSGQITLFDHH
jgi:acid stress chaperone HdeA